MPTITLPARCDRAAVDALLPQLLAASHEGRIEIDGSAVEQPGLALMQVLLSARRSGQGATIIASSALAEAGRLTGLSQDLFAEPEA